MQHYFNNTNGHITDDFNQNYLLFDNKMKFTEDQLYKYHEYLSDIDEEDEKSDGISNVYQIYYPNKRLDKNDNGDSTIADPQKCVKAIENGYPSEVDNTTGDSNYSVPRVHNLFDTQTLKKMLHSGHRKDNSSIPIKLLCHKATVSSVIDLKPSVDSPRCYHHSNSIVSPQFSSPTLATSQLNCSLSVNKDSSGLSNVSFSSLNQTKSRFIGSNLCSSSTLLLKKVHKSQRSNSLIVRTKSRISLLESNNLQNHSESCLSLNDQRHLQQSTPMKVKDKTRNKCPSSSKFFNQNFKLNFSDV